MHSTRDNILFGFYVDKNKNLILTGLIFYPQNRLYPTIISAAAVITRKKVVGNIKAQVMPKPTQNSMRPHNRFIPILPKRNVYDRLCGLLDNDSQQFCIFPVIMNFTSSRVNFLYQTAFLIERNSIAENLIIAVFKLFCIHAFIDLAQCRFTAFFHFLKCGRTLNLKDSEPSVFRIAYDHITPSLTVFSVGFHHIPRTGEDSSKECMIKIFFIIVITDCFSK